MGAGKTATCQILKQKLNNSIFLDGDWCWDMHPFHVTEETKQMVLENICYILNNFIRCSAYENIIFCWVMHQQAIIDDILSRLDTVNCKVHSISLICSEQSLRTRLEKDIAAGIRTEDVVLRSMERIPLYGKLNTFKVDVSEIIPEQVANYIIHHC
ncbi:AAA domain-containing protein [Faecalicatena contorta]|uniref:AAA domain-containing protein n=2 Tax=Bacillota TaxID=1239 RepID=A0A316A188_9FIRM|nr:AAA domain-containing protein [Faecalicatena contorta]SUQ12929.1 AAA domain-containing protein [Faecalicatena contorta]